MGGVPGWRSTLSPHPENHLGALVIDTGRWASECQEGAWTSEFITPWYSYAELQRGKWPVTHLGCAEVFLTLQDRTWVPL